MKLKSQKNSDKPDNSPQPPKLSETSSPLSAVTDQAPNSAATTQPAKEDIKKLMAERDEYLKLSQRIQADFLNYQKRIKREKEEWEKYKDENILQQLLTAFDSLDRVLRIKCESQEAQCLIEGIDLTKKELLRILEKNGVTRIKTTGEKFDPARHEAVIVVEDEKQPDNTVIEELSPGYFLFDRVLRPAKIKVNKIKNPESAKTPPVAEPPITA